MIRILLFLVLCIAFSGGLSAQDALRLPPENRAWYLNTTNPGSCVQCSIGMAGVWQNEPRAATLFFQTHNFGPAIQGGSSPSRVEAYSDARRMPVYNVTGAATFEWMKWAAKTGRMAATGCFPVHFQTLVYYDEASPKPWKICNNNSPGRIDEYTDAEFRRHHLDSGPWVVILKTPPPPVPPVYVDWWNR